MRILEINIDENGSMISLYSDILNDIGEMNISRASNVEFDLDKQKWFVEMCNDLFPKACLINLFENRQDALDAEVDYLNNLIRII